jgi:hypothetical protein
MADYRLPWAKAREARLIPDLAPIRADTGSAVLNLYDALFESNPRMPMRDDQIACRYSELNEAQRALHGVYQIAALVPPWEWLSYLLDRRPLLPLIVWSGRFVGIGKTGEYIEHLIAMDGGDPEMLGRAFAENPDRAYKSATWSAPRFGIGQDEIRSASIEWWSSDGPGQMDFNERVLDFVLRRMSDLIAPDTND